MSQRLIFDIETNGLLDQLDRIHSLVVKDADTLQVWSCHNHEGSKFSIDEGINLLQSADQIIGHNIIGFDIPAIKIVYPGFSPKGKTFDTLNAARLIWPKEEM